MAKKTVRANCCRRFSLKTRQSGSAADEIRQKPVQAHWSQNAALHGIIPARFR